MSPMAGRAWSRVERVHWGPRMTPAVLGILIANGVAYFLHHLVIPVLMESAGGIAYTDSFLAISILLGLGRDALSEGRVWQFVTYFFLHGGFLHLFFNMLALYFFAPDVEAVWGSWAFLRYYFLCGLAAGACQIALTDAKLVGASGAVYGVLVAFALLYPRRPVYIWGLVPIPARVLVILYILLEVFLLGRNDGIGHLSHLGGAAFGWLYIRRGWDVRGFREALLGKWRRRRFRALDPGDDRENDPRYWN